MDGPVQVEKFDKISDITKFILGTGGSLGALGGFIGDFLLPAIEIGEIVFGLCILVILLAITIRFVVPSFHKYLDENHTYWCTPFLIVTLVVGSLVYVGQIASKNFGDDNNGIIATALPQLQGIQQALGILSSIDSKMSELVEATNEGNELIQDGNDLTEIGNSQRDLTNKGVFWNLNTLSNALVMGDLETLEIFRKGGKDLSMVSRPEMNMGIHSSIILNAISNNHSNIDRVLEYLIKHKAIKLNSLFQESIISEGVQNIWQSYISDIEIHNNNKRLNDRAINDKLDSDYEQARKEYKRSVASIRLERKNAYEDYKKKSSLISEKMKDVYALAQEAYINNEKGSDGKSLSYDQLVQLIAKRKGIKQLARFDSDLYSERISNLEQPKRSRISDVSARAISNKSISPVQKAMVSIYTKARWADNKKVIKYLRQKGANKVYGGGVTLSDRTVLKVE